MKAIKQLLAGKSPEIYHVAPEATVFDAIALMSVKGIGALLVMADSKLVGIVSERDYARKVILKDRSSKETRVEEIMTPGVVTIDAQKGADEGLEIMTNERIRHLPVMDGDQLVGVVSIGDLVKAIIAEQQFLIEQLNNYVSG